LQAQGFRISFTLLVEVLFTFPSQYSSTIGLTGVFSLAGWSRRIRAGFLVSRATQDAAMPAQASGTGLSPPAARLSSRFPSPLPCNTAVLQPPACVATRRVWAPPRSLAATGGIIGLFSFPPGTKMFQFPGLALPHPAEVPVLQTGGLSHSEIRGSTVTCTYPRLVAACHVLRRLREPRHPPCALNHFLAVAACPRTWAGNAAAHTFSCSVRSRPVRYIPQGGGRFSVVNFTVLLVSICQRSARNAGRPERGARPGVRKAAPRGGEYRGRTDDLLHAMQAL
jgi:hypothetical protein